MWQGLLGHDDVVERLRRAAAAGRLASTYLFLGPAGVGKHAFARLFAKALLCQRRSEVDLDPCGDCPSCVLCATGGHPDIHEVARLPDAKTLKLDQLLGEREHRHATGFCHELSLRPLMGRRRVGIIDDADWMTVETANCLLKTLEEPPPGAVLILIGTSRHRFLPTILSRVQTIPFQALTTDDAAQLILAAELAPDATAAAALAQLSGGSLQRARDVADPQLWQMRDEFVAAWTAGRFDAAAAAERFDGFLAGGGKEAEMRRKRFRLLLGVVADALRDDLRTACRQGMPSDGGIAALDRTLAAEDQLERNANQATLLECWLDDLAAAAPASR